MMHSRPWLQYYSDADRAWQPRYRDMLRAFRAAVELGSGGVRYFGARLSWGDIDLASDRLAVWAAGQGVARGDRISIVLQNVPSSIIAMVAAWKLGAIPVPSNPMYRAPELAQIFADCAPSLVICHEHEVAQTDAALALAGLDPPVRTVTPADHAAEPDPRLITAVESRASKRSLMSILGAADGRPAAVDMNASDIALVLYTSGTTGRPKGAMLRHESLTNNGQYTGDWCGVGNKSRVLVIAPLFHITGVACNICLAIVQDCDLILSYRFEASVMLDTIRRERPTWSIGAITAFNALASHPDARREDFASFQEIYTGGAPVPPALQNALREKTGVTLRNSYGMTETAAPTHFTLRNHQTPVDPESGALSIGIPGYATDARVVDEQGVEVPPGTAGELLMKGRQVMAGYWRKPEETAEALAGGWMHSGDIAIMDQNGWFYLIDRKKDMINASGFKVWPREVEDVLYQHAAVREAAVVGEPDDYRGETVVAYVSLQPGVVVESAALIAHCRDQLAAYKCPRDVRVLDDLPKTVSGKIQRKLLRDLAGARATA